MGEGEDRAARQDIVELLVRYATAIDGRDWDLLRRCFTPDCHADYEGIGVWHGIDELTRFMVDAHAGFGPTMHRISNAAVTVTGDRATARAYVDVVAMAPDGASGVTAVGWYDDELVRTDGGWRIARRRFTPIHMGTLSF
jgi:3-phenylpropionate/cinnamic acid dioxygenase small subunit